MKSNMRMVSNPIFSKNLYRILEKGVIINELEVDTNCNHLRSDYKIFIMEERVHGKFKIRKIN